MEDNILFEEGSVLVTRAKIKYEGNYYLLNTIKNVIPIKEPFDTKGFIIGLSQQR